MPEDEFGLKTVPLQGTLKVRTDNGNNSISLAEGRSGDAKWRPTGRRVFVILVERKCSLNRSARRLPVSPFLTNNVFSGHVNLLVTGRRPSGLSISVEAFV